MKRITNKNTDGSINVLDDYGYMSHTVGNNEYGLISTLANRVNEL